MTQQSPTTPSTPNSRGTTSGGLGIFAFGIAILALVFCWIPGLGLLTIPIAGIALIIGIVGFVIARSGSTAGTALPLIAVILAALAILISFLFIRSSAKHKLPEHQTTLLIRGQ